MKTTFLAFWLMLMKPPAPASRGPNFETLSEPLVGLREAEKREVETAAVVEVELVRLVDHRLRIGRRAKIHPARGYAADHAGLRGERNKINDLFLIGNGSNAFGHADAEIDDTVGLQFERGAARDDLSRAVFHHRK